MPYDWEDPDFNAWQGACVRLAQFSARAVDLGNQIADAREREDRPGVIAALRDYEITLNGMSANAEIAAEAAASIRANLEAEAK